MMVMHERKVPTTRGSLSRSCTLGAIGIFRISRRDASLYSVQIFSGGGWARIKVMTGLGRQIFEQVSCFSGSFWLGLGCEEGIIVELYSDDRVPTIALNWREVDQAVA